MEDPVRLDHPRGRYRRLGPVRSLGDAFGEARNQATAHENVDMEQEDVCEPDAC